jgi:hypothetical protein
MLKTPWNRQDLILIHVNARTTPYVFLKRWSGSTAVLSGASTMAVFQHLRPLLGMFLMRSIVTEVSRAFTKSP